MFFDYPAQPESGFWGPPTSTIDWCEENYVVTDYIAEFVNTVTNAGFIYLAYFALRNSIQYKLESRFVLSSCGFMLVGIGSWLFHMTLKYEFQLLDELPMIYATCIPLWSTFTWQKGTLATSLFGSAVFLGAMFLTAVYLRLKIPEIHQAAYGTLNVLIILKSFSQSRIYVQNPTARRALNKTLIVGVSEFLFGFFLWNLDTHLCGFWIRMRHAVGLPLGLLIEGHGWWHVFTGLGVYSYLQYLEYLRIFQIGIDQDYEYVWKWGFFPITQKRFKKIN